MRHRKKRASLLSGLHVAFTGGHVSEDGFTETVLAWLGQSGAAARIDGSVADTAAKNMFQLLAWIDEHTVPHAQEVESDNSVLRIPTSRSSKINI